MYTSESARYFGRTRISFKLPKDERQQVPVRVSQSQNTVALPKGREMKRGEEISHTELCDGLCDFHLYQGPQKWNKALCVKDLGLQSGTAPDLVFSEMVESSIFFFRPEEHEWQKEVERFAGTHMSVRPRRRHEPSAVLCDSVHVLRCDSLAASPIDACLD